MSEAELTPEAKDAIRAFMLKFVIPSGVILTIVSGILGFVVSGLAKIDATATAVEHANTAAEKAVEAAADAKNANLRASESAKSADDAYATLREAKTQMDHIFSGQYESFSQSLFATKGFRETLGKIGDQQFRDLSAKIDDSVWHSGILGAGTIRSGQLTDHSDGVSFDSGSGKVSFPNSKNLRFIPIVSFIAANGQYATETCFVKGTGANFVVVWQGAQDTSGRNHPPTDCSFAIVGMNTP